MCCAVLSHFSRMQPYWTIAQQAPLSMGFSRQEYWSGLICPPPGNLPDPGIEQSFYPSSTWEGRWSVFHGGRRAWRPLLQEKTGEIAGKALIPAPTAPNFTTHCLVGKLLLAHTGWPPLSPHTWVIFFQTVLLRYKSCSVQFTLLRVQSYGF